MQGDYVFCPGGILKKNPVISGSDIFREIKLTRTSHITARWKSPSGALTDGTFQLEPLADSLFATKADKTIWC